MRRRTSIPVLILLAGLAAMPVGAADLRAGAAKVDITHPDQPTQPNDGLFARALVLSDGDTTTVLITLDVVAVGEIGHVKNDYLPTVRAALEKELGIKPQHVLINASHCHGVPCSDVAQRTVAAVKQAAGRMTPVKVGVGTGHEDRVSENRRLRLKNGREADVRHAYSLPPDAEVVGAGPIDPEIGIVRLDAEDGRTVAVVYNFACHPIQGVPSGRNTADMTGFSSRVIEDNLAGGAVALFVQGCGGDINPVFYKDVDHPRDAETLGNMLGLSTLKAVHKIRTNDAGTLKVINETLGLPRADLVRRIESLESERLRLVESLKGTSLNLKTFLPLVVKHGLSAEFPSYYSHLYLHEKKVGRNNLEKLDADNRRNVEAYVRNIQVMEELTRLQTNLALLKKHHEEGVQAGTKTVDVEVVGLRVGEFVLMTFPGELTCQIGLSIKARSPHKPTFVAGYTNGYIYYTPTAQQLANIGGAQEDSDCIVAPEWQKLFEDKVGDILKRL